MTDTTVKKVSAAQSPKGEMGQTYLVSGKRLSMRLWRTGPEDSEKAPSWREYETAGYDLEGSAELQIEGQSIRLEPGDSWLVPPDVEHLDAIFVDEHDPHVNPLGAKGVAEIAICGVAPAIASAVYHATGRRVRELPITPERLLL
jgi:uncharacterized cupin superfamily protein